MLRIANASRGPDEFGYRSEFVELVRAAKSAQTMAAARALAAPGRRRSPPAPAAAQKTPSTRLRLWL